MDIAFESLLSKLTPMISKEGNGVNDTLYRGRKVPASQTIYFKVLFALDTPNFAGRDDPVPDDGAEVTRVSLFVCGNWHLLNNK